MKKRDSSIFASKDNDGKDIRYLQVFFKEKVISDCDQSLKRLGTDYIDLLPDPLARSHNSCF